MGDRERLEASVHLAAKLVMYFLMGKNPIGIGSSLYNLDSFPQKIYAFDY